MKRQYFVTAGLLGMGVVLFFYSLNRFFNNDEFEAIHTTWKMLQGGTIYVDFFQHHNPLLYYLLMPIVAIFAPSTTTLIVARLFILFLVFLIGLTTYALANTLFDKKTALLSVFILYSFHIFIVKIIEIRPDVPQVLFGMLSLLFLFKYFKSHSRVHLVTSALALSFSFLSVQKAVFLGFFIGIVLLVDTWRKQTTVTNFFTYWISFSIPILTFFAYLLYNNMFQTYFYFNDTLNLKSEIYHPPIEAILYSVTTTPIIYLFYLIALFFYVKTPLEKYFAFISLGLFFSIFSYPLDCKQYLLPMTLPVAIFAAHGLSSVFRSHKKKNLFITLLVLAMTLPPTTIYLKRVFRTSTPEEYWLNNTLQLEKIKYVSSYLTKNDYVYEFAFKSWNLFWKDLDFFWLSPRMLCRHQRVTGYHYDQYELIEKYKPKLIAVKDVDEKHPLIKKGYTKSKIYDDIFIKKDATKILKATRASQ